MGSIGLNFGSPTSGAGFDVTTTVSQIVGNLQAQETPYKTQLATLTSEDTAISSLGSLLATLSTDMQSLTGATGVLSSLTGSSSNTNVLALTSAGTGATAGSHSIVVSKLAQTSSVYADPVAAADTFSGSLSIQVGTGAALSVPVNPASATLSGLAASINAANAGVTASVITGSAGNQLSLVSATSGAAGSITVGAGGLTDTTTGAGVSFSIGQAAQDAQLTVDGIPATSSSNTVSDVLPGVTFQLLDASATPVQVQIVNDTASVSTALNSFVTDYNAVVNALSAQEGNTASGTAAPLYGNPLVSTIQEQLASAVSLSSGTGSNAVSLATAGLSVGSDGTLSLDSNVLNTALNANYASVVTLFQGAGGAGETLASAAENLGTGQPDAVLSLAATANAAEEKDLNSTITTMNTNIATQQTQLTASLNAANETLQQIPTQLQIVSELYSAITGYGAQTNG